MVDGREETDGRTEAAALVEKAITYLMPGRDVGRFTLQWLREHGSWIHLGSMPVIEWAPGQPIPVNYPEVGRG